MGNVSKAMEYAAAFERDAIRERVETALGNLDHMNLIEIQEMVLHHEQQIKDIAAHLLELKRLVTPMMEFKRLEWVGLTEEEIKQCSYDAEGFMIDREVAIRAVEAKLKEKNT